MFCVIGDTIVQIANVNAITSVPLGNDEIGVRVHFNNGEALHIHDVKLADAIEILKHLIVPGVEQPEAKPSAPSKLPFPSPR